MKNGRETKILRTRALEFSSVLLVTLVLVVRIIVLHQQGSYSRGQQRQPNEGTAFAFV